MREDRPNGQTGYVLDDAEMIAKFIQDDWDIPIPILIKPIVFFNQDVDPDTFNFATGDIQCIIYSDDISKIPLGIGFDGYEVQRNILITLKSMSRTKVIKASDEIERIMALHAIRPGNGWHMLYDVTDMPIKQGRKMYRRDLSLILKAYWRPRVLQERKPNCTGYAQIVKDDE